MSEKAPTIPLPNFATYSEEEAIQRSKEFYQLVNKRRTVRDYIDKDVPEEIIANAIKAANTAPSGANHQPWHFVAVKNPEIKRKIREAAEVEEYNFYKGKPNEEWLDALSHIGTDEHKPFLETAPWLIAVFIEKHGFHEDGSIKKNYYTMESVGLATGLLITALHNAGLATLTHTPSPMKFLCEVLDRPKNEKPFLLLVTGYPTEDCQVPDISRKSLDEMATFLR